MANCGCKPCKKPIEKVRKCKPFNMCVGNKTLVWDGECLSLLDRKYQIPNGTYTSITFTNGCITDVGVAPLQQYTPQTCCDNTESNNNNVQNELVLSKNNSNIATITNNTLDVSLVYGNSKSISTQGFGSGDKPITQEVKLSATKGNKLSIQNDGLLAEMYFGTSDNVEVSGEGTKAKPYVFNVKGADAKLPEINKGKDKIVGPGFEIDKFGRFVLTGEKFTLLSNTEFSSKAFSINYTGPTTRINVDNELLLSDLDIRTHIGLSGKGTTKDPLRLSIDDSFLYDLLDAIEQNQSVKERFKQILGG